MRYFFLFFIFYFYSSANGQTTADRDSFSIINIACTTCIGQPVSINTMEFVSGKVIVHDKSTVDISGKAKLKIFHAYPLSAFVIIENDSKTKYLRLYIEPRQEVKILLSNDSISFDGNLKLVNKYLLELDMLGDKLVKQSNRLVGKFDKLSPEDQQDIQTNFGSEFQELNKAIENDNRIPELAKEFLKYDNKFFIQRRKQAIVGLKFSSTEEKINYSATFFFEEIPVCVTCLKVNIDSYDYFMSLNMDVYLDRSIFLSLKKDGKEADKDTLVLLSDKAIRNNTRTLLIREYLLAKNIFRKIKKYGISSNVRQIFDEFKKDYPSSEYTSVLEEEYDKDAALGEGMIAKNFKADNIDGNKFALEQLKGKIVYMDTWATWCLPCIEEFPQSIKMIKHFRNSAEVVFLFVSVDTNIKKWKDFVASGKAPNGIHVNHNSHSEGVSVYDLYRMYGIPHYALIDKEGKIVKNRAPTPSSQITYQLINYIINNSK